MPGRRGRPFLVACAVALSLASPARAYYEEAHVTGDEVKVAVDSSGLARVEHTIAWHLVAGQYHSFDIPIPSEPLVLEPTVSVTSEEGRAFTASLVPHESPHETSGLRILFDEPKGLRHGRYQIRFSYREDLVASHAFSRDGVMWRLTFTGPVFADGYDGARVTFDLPSSVEEPRLADTDNAATILSTFRRAEGKDEIELVLPHLARHEVPSWAIRVAPHAFSDVRDPALRPPPARPAAIVQEGKSPVLLLVGALMLGLAYGALARRRASTFDRKCLEHKTSAKGLVPLPHDLRAALSGLCLAAGVVLESEGFPTWGSACVAAAMLLATLRPPLVRVSPRGPGRWLALRPSEAFPRRAGDAFDPFTARGAWVALGVLALLAATALVLRRVAPEAPLLVALDSLALIPLVATGRDSQLPPLARWGSPWLWRLWKRLAREKSLRVAPWVRVPTGSTEPDEVRVLAVPRAAMPGLVGIEIGLASWHAETCYGSVPEVLVRVHESSAASARMTTLATRLCPVPGRLPEERVYRLVPRLPTRDGTLLLVRRLGRELEDRRFSTVPWEREERRLPPSVRERPLATAA
jgi:hypothetical protein